MGMAASQARFLGITARKSNTEYQGQQINQQRLALANETANLFKQHLNLKVPLPPVPADYTKLVYRFKDGDRNFEVRSGLGNSVSTIREYSVANLMRSQPTNSGRTVTISQNTEDNSLYINGRLLTLLDTPAIQIKKILEESNDPNNNSAFRLVGGGTVSVQQYQAATDAEKAAFIADLDLADPSNKLYSYVNNNVTTFVQASYVEDKANAGGISIPIEFYDYDYTQVKDINFQNCTWQSDTSGRYTQMTGIPAGETVARTFDLDCMQIQDEDAFNDAMAKYLYDDAMYNKAVSDINAKTEIIQAQDRALEIQLKQLDTEQKALQTEMDAIKKVIDKNVETSFKTFG